MSFGYIFKEILKPQGMFDKDVNAVVLRGEGDYLFTLERKKMCDDVTKVCLRPEVKRVSLNSN